MQSGSGAISPTDVPGRTHGDRIAVRVSGRALLAAAAGDTRRAMSQENVKIVRRGFAGFAESGAEGVIPFYTEDAIIYSIPEWPDDLSTTGTTALGSSRGSGGRTSTISGSIFASSMTEVPRWLPCLSSPDRPKVPPSR